MIQRIQGYCTLCRSRCGSITLVENDRMIGVEPLRGHPTGGALCAKGRAAPEMVHSPRRLTKPLRRITPKGATDPRWEVISWDEALDEVAARLGAVRQESGAEAVAFAVTTPSGTPMVDSAEWVERFIRCFGSPNIIYAVEVCGWHKDYAHALTFGRGIGFPDYEQAEMIILWGHNPARTWLAQATRIAEARLRGAKVVVIDPKPGGSGQIADLWLRIRPGADGALAMAAIRHLLATSSYDAGFVASATNGPLLVDETTGQFIRADALFPNSDPGAFVVLGVDGKPYAYDTRLPLEQKIQLDARCHIPARFGGQITANTAFRLLREAAEPYTTEHVTKITWLEVAAIEGFCELIATSRRIAYHSWTGVGQHTNATQIERAIATLYALTGACDRPGGNIWPVPPPTQAVNDLSLLPPGQKEKALGLERLPLGPPARGWVTARDFARSVLEGQPYRTRALMSWGTNFIGSQSDAPRNIAVLQALEFHVHADMFMNPTAEYADIVLPVGMPWEREALKIGFEITQEAVETIQYRPAMLPRHGQSKADYEIAFELAERLGHGGAFFGGDIRKGWNHQLAPLGVTVDELKAHPAGQRFTQEFHYEKWARATPNGAITGFATPTRRAELYSELLLKHGQSPLPDHVEPGESPLRPEADARFPLVLTTAKSGWFIHTSFRHIASLSKKSPDPIVEISPVLAASRGLRDGEWALVDTRSGSVRLRAKLNDCLDHRVVVAEFGWWEDSPATGRNRSDTIEPGANINAVLSDRQSDPVSGSVPLRAITCEIRPDKQANRGVWEGLRAFRVAKTMHEGEEVLALDLVPGDSGDLPNFRPGQHVELLLPGEKKGRAYSLTNSGDAPDQLSLGIRCQAAGPDEIPTLSARAYALKPGDEVCLSPPTGVFNPPPSGNRPVVLIAAGIGITPFLSYLETLAGRGSLPHAPAVHLLYGCRHGGLHPFRSRLDALVSTIPNFSRVTAYSAPRAEDQLGTDYDYHGRVDVAALKPLFEQRPLVYLCGSSAFVSETSAALIRLGMHAFDILSEAFVSPPEAPAQLSAQMVRFIGSDKEFLWQPENGSLLDAAREAGLDLPSGCRVGQCESCALTLVQGEVSHLVPVDLEPGRCLACIAVPLSPLTLSI